MDGLRIFAMMLVALFGGVAGISFHIVCGRVIGAICGRSFRSRVRAGRAWRAPWLLSLLIVVVPPVVLTFADPVAALEVHVRHPRHGSKSVPGVASREAVLFHLVLLGARIRAHAMGVLVRECAETGRF